MVVQTSFRYNTVVDDELPDHQPQFIWNRNPYHNHRLTILDFGLPAEEGSEGHVSVDDSDDDIPDLIDDDYDEDVGMPELTELD